MGKLDNAWSSVGAVEYVRKRAEAPWKSVKLWERIETSGDARLPLETRKKLKESRGNPKKLEEARGKMLMRFQDRGNSWRLARP